MVEVPATGAVRARVGSPEITGLQPRRPCVSDPGDAHVWGPVSAGLRGVEMQMGPRERGWARPGSGSQAEAPEDSRSLASCLLLS